nr:hypothetical protein [Tanacetum cinerariifolium]
KAGKLQSPDELINQEDDKVKEYQNGDGEKDSISALELSETISFGRRGDELSYNNLLGYWFELGSEGVSGEGYWVVVERQEKRGRWSGKGCWFELGSDGVSGEGYWVVVERQEKRRRWSGKVGGKNGFVYNNILNRREDDGTV